MSSHLNIQASQSISDYFQAKMGKSSDASNLADSGKALPAAKVGAVAEASVSSSASDLSRDPQQVAEIVKKLQEEIQHTRREIKFEVNEELGRSIVSVLDQDTKEVIRQFPPEEIVELAERFAELNSDSGGKLFRTVV